MERASKVFHEEMTVGNSTRPEMGEKSQRRGTYVEVNFATMNRPRPTRNSPWFAHCGPDVAVRARMKVVERGAGGQYSSSVDSARVGAAWDSIPKAAGVIGVAERR